LGVLFFRTPFFGPNVRTVMLWYVWIYGKYIGMIEALTYKTALRKVYRAGQVHSSAIRLEREEGKKYENSHKRI
jgi:hypothetical protein